MQNLKHAAVAMLLLTAFAAVGCQSNFRGTPGAVGEEPTWRSFTPRGARTQARNALGLGPDEQLARSLYSEAEQEFQRAGTLRQNPDTADEAKDAFLAAADKFDTAAARWPDSMLQENALFMQGESLFFADRYSGAGDVFDELVKNYPNTRHIDRVAARRFDISQYWLAAHRNDPKFFLSPNIGDGTLPRNDTHGAAVKLLDKIRLDDPTGRLADDATMAAANAHFVRGDYREAATLFSDLRRTYPDSHHQFEAALLSVKAKTELYQGSDYDSTELEEAGDMIQFMFQQFPEQAAEHREYLENAYKDIRVKLASRDYEMAQFFDTKAEYAGARFYYNKVIRDFSDTSLAQDAERRLAKIGSRPDKPEQRAQWLVDRIPSKKRQDKPLLAESPFKWLRR